LTEDSGAAFHAAGRAEKTMSVCDGHECGYCGRSIAFGQRWVREKIYDSAPQNRREPEYQRYHAEVFAGEELSCWEKHQLQQEMARTMAHAA
jgi:hypothetical protein